MRFLLIPLLTLALTGCELPGLTPEQRSDQFAYAAQETLGQLLRQAKRLHTNNDLSDDNYRNFLEVARDAVLFVDEYESAFDSLDPAEMDALLACSRPDFDQTGDGQCDREDITAYLDRLAEALE